MLWAMPKRANIGRTIGTTIIRSMTRKSHATSKPHGFLTIDMDPPTPEKRFRSQYDEYLY